MKLLSRLFRRSSKIGLLSDVAMVSSAAYRVARRGDGAGAKRATPVQWILVATAAVRILGRVRQVRSRRRAGAGS